MVTVARSDYGIYQSLLKAIQADPDLELRLMVAGMHLAPEFGMTVRDIERDGYPIDARIDMALTGDSPEAIARSTGLGVTGFAQAFARSRPDILVVLGDRFDMYGAALAALPFKIPVAHIHGGEVTHGAMDDALRHSLTKLSHLHFTSTQEAARRVIQLGEQPWRVSVSGAPALDGLDSIAMLTREQLEDRIGFPLRPAPLLVTFHPVTLQYEATADQTDALLGALEDCGLPIVFTAPNADTAGRQVRTRIEAYVAAHPNSTFVENFGQSGYFTMMREASAMVGNSSSGIIEAASFHLPVVNIGQRQGGRQRGGNVLDAECEREAIRVAISRATAPEFRALVGAMENPYRVAGRSAASMIVEKLKAVPLDEDLVLKRFHDL